VNKDAALSGDDGSEDLMARVDTSVPVSARIWNYRMGGSDYYPVDKEAGDACARLSPGENDDEVARSIIDRLKDALPSGGYLVMYEGVDTDPAQAEALRQYNESGAIPYRLRQPD
jgi:S-adenosyl methyltransferase